MLGAGLQISTTTEEFLTFEEELLRIGELTGASLPPMTEGPYGFFAALPGWLQRSGAGLLLPDPSLNLALPYAREELLVALALAKGRVPNETELLSHAEETGVSAEMMASPILALSGGERMLLSMSKACALAGYHKLAVVASPYFWLDATNRERVDQLTTAYQTKDCEAYLLLLEGEDAEDPDSGQVDLPPICDLEWSFSMRELQVDYAGQTFPQRTPGKNIKFAGPDGPFRLRSPTVLSGRNGVGKSTFAKVLTGLIVPTTGHVKLAVGGFSGHGRLLLQDTLIQLFALDPEAHLRRVFGRNAELLKNALEMFGELQVTCAASLDALGGSATIGGRGGHASILQAKLALAVERLVAGTPLLVMDEPGWCLSRPVAYHYLASVANAAHSQGTAVLVISHRARWWNGLTRTVIDLLDSDGVVHVAARDI